MQVKIDKYTIELKEGMACSLKDVREKDGITFYDFQFNWTTENAENDDEFIVMWMDEVKGAMYKWDSSCKIRRNMMDDPWADAFPSMISVNAPVTCLFDGKDKNCYTWALSECCKLMKIQNGIDDYETCMIPQFSFNVRQFTNQYETVITLYIDRRPIPMQKSVADVVDWWANDLGMTPMPVPPAAREPLYSFWYSHHQNVSEEIVEAECRRAKDLGFEICIVDDGWHTDTTNGGYAYCGDWIPAKSKFPNMAEHVKRVHEIGMKYILWYSVPLIGYNSEHFKEFESMLLRDVPHLYAQLLDPRYKETRAFMVETYKKALTEWDLDGFKLDFIDTWTDIPANAPYNERMDIPALQDAVNVCMNEIVSELIKIKPDILLEFRQGYVGPHMKQFGNMFRVADCPGDYLKNRASIFDLRMLMGDQAVHSDMLMLAPFDDPETNALQIISCMFGTLQYSGKLSRIDDASRKMSRFWLSFLKEHRELLQSKNLTTYEAHLLYTWAKATEGNECAVGVYAIDKCVKPDAMDTIYIANGCMGDRVFVELDGKYAVQILDCYGEEVESSVQELRGVNILNVPMGGLIVLKKA